MDLHDLDAFAQVVEHGGFSAAERALGVPKSRLSRRVSQLEKSLGVRLLQRSTRRFAVTDLGRDVYRHAVNMRAEANAAIEAVDQARSEPQGMLRVSVPVSIAEHQLSALLPDFLRRHPKVRLQLLVSNRRFDPIDEGLDVAIRVRERLDTDQSLAMRSFGSIRSVLVASPAYVAQAGAPGHPDELVRHALLSMGEHDSVQRWTLQPAGGDRIELPVQPRLMAKSFPLLLALAVDGHGIALMPETACAEAVRGGRLAIVLPQWSLPEGICHAVFPSRRGMLPMVRVFLDDLAERLPPLLEQSHLLCRSARNGQAQ